ncbi:MAG: GspE/PulE family protein [Isosphaeraceae bacterium]|nr:GspE/PulE family protein [Isosphaeraceae bacterium]
MEPTTFFPRPAGGSVPATAAKSKKEGTAIVPSPPDQTLSASLVALGLMTAEQLDEARQYGKQYHRDLRQSVLDLNFIAPEKLNELAFERISTLVPEDGSPPHAEEATALPAVGGSPLLPDRVQFEQDVRNELRGLAATATLPDLLAHVLDRALDSRATDIHFDPRETGLRVRYRIDGQLQDVLEVDPSLTTALASRIKVMSNLNIVERRHSQDGRITIQHYGRARDLRVSTFPTALGEKIVIRVHEVLTDAPSFEHLGMSPRQAEQLTRIIAKPYGAVLVAGPVGAGKTSTLYNCLGKINSPALNIMTIEDPIENRIEGINQTQVDARGDLRFADGLKAMLRQDPDVIMIGEIRDEETAHIGIRASLTGVLVFSTIHASDSPSTIGNLFNFGIPGYQVSTSLLAVVSQRLIRRICPYCRVSYPADPKVMAALDLNPDDHEGLVLHKGLGCPACFQTGYHGRTGIFEIMEIGEELRELIFQQIPKDILRRVAIDLGMQTLKSAAVDKILDGTTTVEEAYRVVSM